MRILVLSLLVGASVTQGQIPEKFTNLQVLPRGISRSELTNIMRGFSFSLGVRCENCHVAKTPGALIGMDFAADTQDMKKTARTMLRMVDAINRDYVGKLEKPTQTRVDCATCHHGLQHPRSLQAVLEGEFGRKG